MFVLFLRPPGPPLCVVLRPWQALPLSSVSPSARRLSAMAHRTWGTAQGREAPELVIGVLNLHA
jgi:hypothetical protein